MRNQRGDVCKLRRLGLKEFTARGNVEEQVTHRDRSADWESSFFDREDFSSCDLDDRTGSVFSGVCLEKQAAHRCDGRQCFAAKSKGCDIEQVVGIADFRRGVTLEGEHSVVVQHAPTIIDDLDKLASTGLDVDADSARARIERVLQQLLHNGCGTLHHLAGGNLVGNVFGEDVDAAHGYYVT